MSVPGAHLVERGILGEDHVFQVPAKAIKSPEDMPTWDKSEAYNEYLGFVLTLNEAVHGKAVNSECPASQTVQDTLAMLDRIDGWITEIPPTDQPQRFGNKAFRDWHTRLKERSEEELKKVLPEKLHKAVVELSQYLCEAFGNPTRIDYGTGHEMAFIMFLCCMFKIGAYKSDDKVAAVNKVFNLYMDLVRRLQLVYRMEPAGSRGAWSLDDYQFVPFLWGSAQLIGHPRIEPHHFVERGIVENHYKDYLFLSCVNFTSQVKVGPFAEHSNQLWNVSGVKSWARVNAGLIRMYKAEVLTKFPVIQHVLFGSLFTLKPAPTGPMYKGACLVPPAPQQLPT